MSKLRFGPYVLSGILTIIPIWISWTVFDFFWDKLARAGMPWVRLLADGFRRRDMPAVADFLAQPWVDEAMAAILTILGLYLLGWAATQVIGGRLILMAEQLILKVPFIGFVYGAVRKLIAVLRDKPEGAERVVVVDFPNAEMKAIGLVMKTITDATTGTRLAAVYVPTAPNPTSGYLEIIPVDRLISTDWSVDQAMNFVMTMGAVSPERVNYACSAVDPAGPAAAAPARPPTTEPGRHPATGGNP
jgi:uncharacterized membrane protein